MNLTLGGEVLMQFRRVTVIGGSGFIGRYIVKRLARRDAVVTVIGRHAVSAGYLRPMGDVGQVATLNAGLGDEKLLAAAIAGADAVICTAGILYQRGAQRFDLVHHRGPALLARLASAEGCRRFIHVSAIGADPASPSAYARSKAAGEAAVRDAFPGATILRPSIVFGPEDAFFNRFATMARYLPALPLIGGGRTRFQPVYVGDVADAALAALDHAEAPGRTYELGGPEVLSFRQLMELMLREIQRRRALISVPFALAAFEAAFLELLPNPPLTRDQVKLLKHDVIVTPGAYGLGDLGILPTAMELVLPGYLGRFRRGGAWRAPERSAAYGPPGH
jgi:uncharacterized protein YbjT (DUF2867 family)